MIHLIQSAFIWVYSFKPIIIINIISHKNFKIRRGSILIILGERNPPAGRGIFSHVQAIIMRVVLLAHAHTAIWLEHYWNWKIKHAHTTPTQWPLSRTRLRDAEAISALVCVMFMSAHMWYEYAAAAAAAAVVRSTRRVVYAKWHVTNCCYSLKKLAYKLCFDGVRAMRRFSSTVCSMCVIYRTHETNERTRPNRTRVRNENCPMLSASE